MTMNSSLAWKLLYAAREKAAREGEEVAKISDFAIPPVDPFEIVESERELIHLEGANFGDCFDGRIRYVGPRFLMCFNNRYNDWPHEGHHHPKVTFTIAHELGHFYLPKHREYLVSSRRSHWSFSEFTANELVEQQADSFASGLLMPGYLLKRIVNSGNFPTKDLIHRTRSEFHVSLTGLLVRWTQLTNFPCATVAIRDGKIAYGWVSESLRKNGAYRLRRGEALRSRGAKDFVADDPSVSAYREGSSAGALFNWIDFDEYKLPTEEHYFALPYSGLVWAIVTADENDLQERYWGND